MNEQQAKIKLYLLPSGGWNVPNTSPPCAKLETWLRITGIPYELGAYSFTAKTPKGKHPFIEDNGVAIGDSALIIEHLKSTRRVDPDAGLTPSERATSLAFRRMVKEHLYWVLMQVRYREQPGWEAFSALLRPMVLGVTGGNAQQTEGILAGVRQGPIDAMFAQGMGRHSNEEVHQLGIADLTALSDFLGDKPFFFGDQPTTADATIFGHVTNLIDIPLDHPLIRFGRTRKNLVEYTKRMRQRFFKELAP